MMGNKTLKPIVMGGAMGLMMLWMIHGVLTDNTNMGTMALLMFAGAHVAIALIFVIVGMWATRFAPSLRKRIERLHRPSLRHVLTMVSAALVVMAFTHLTLHGGI